MKFRFELIAALALSLPGASACCVPEQPCDQEFVVKCVEKIDPWCSNVWDEQCITEAKIRCDLLCESALAKACGAGTVLDLDLQQCVAQYANPQGAETYLTREEFVTYTYRDDEICDEDGVSENQLLGDLVRAVRAPGASRQMMEDLFRALDVDGDDKLTVYELAKALEQGRVSLLDRGWNNPTPAPNHQPNVKPPKRPKYCHLSGGNGFANVFGSEKDWELPCQKKGVCPPESERDPPMTLYGRRRQTRTDSSAALPQVIFAEGASNPPHIVDQNNTLLNFPLSNKDPWYACVNSWGLFHGWWNKDYSSKQQRVDFRIFSNDRCALTVPQVEAGIIALTVLRNVTQLQDEVDKLLEDISNFPGGKFKDVKKIEGCKPKAANKFKLWVPSGAVQCMNAMADIVQSKSLSPILFQEDVFRVQIKKGEPFMDQCLPLPSIWKDATSTKAPTRAPGSSCKCIDDNLPKNMKCPPGTTFGVDECGGGGCQNSPCPKPMKPKGKYVKVDEALVNCKIDEAFSVQVCNDDECLDCSPVNFPRDDACTTDASIKIVSDLVQSATGTCIPMRKDIPTHDFQTVTYLQPKKCWQPFDKCSFEEWNIRPEASIVDLKFFTRDRDDDNNLECLYDPFGEVARQVRNLADRYSADIQVLQSHFQQAIYTPGLPPDKKKALRFVSTMIFPKSIVDFDKLGGDMAKLAKLKPEKIVSKTLLAPDDTLQIWPDPLQPDETACGLNVDTFQGGKNAWAGFSKAGECIKVDYKGCPLTTAPTRKPTAPTTRAPTEKGDPSKAPTTKNPTPIPTYAPTYTTSFPGPMYVKIPDQQCNIYKDIEWNICSDSQCNSCTTHTVPNSWQFITSIKKYTKSNDDVLANLDMSLPGHILPWNIEDRYYRCKTLESMGQPFGTNFPGSILAGCSGGPMLEGQQS